VNGTQKQPETGFSGKNPLSPPNNMRPTLVIGLGGTGQRIVAHLKAYLVRAYGEVPAERIRLLAFDTADETITVLVHGQPLGLEADRELFHIGHTPVPNIVRNLERQPAIAARLPCIQSIPAVALRAGAKQVRPLGTLAFLWRFDPLERRIADAIWELAGKDTLSQRAGNTQGINVFRRLLLLLPAGRPAGPAAQTGQRPGQLDPSLRPGRHAAPGGHGAGRAPRRGDRHGPGDRYPG